jgi:iron complex transport system ATP-binding protein
MPTDATVREYVLLGRTPHLGYLARERRSDVDAADSALERLDLSRFAHRRLGSLSGGERQRATLARALAQDAPILLLDEPTAALDVGRQQQVLEIVDGLRAQAGLTVLSTMHDLTLAGQYADRLLLVDGGRLIAAGTAADVLTGALIAEHYGAEVDVVETPGSGFAVVPVRRST